MLSLSWTSDSTLVSNRLYLPVTTPASSPKPVNLSFYVQSDPGQTDNLANVRFYLDGDPGTLEAVQTTWPAISTTQTALNGGLDISFDGGRTYTRFSTTYGYKQDPATWPLLPASATSFSSQDGVLDAFDAANLTLRLVVPPSATEFGTLDLSLGTLFDVV